MIKQVIVMRTDLGMRKGKMIAQGAHAAMKVLLDRGSVGDSGLLFVALTDEMEEWLTGLFTKICLQVGSESELLALLRKAQECHLPCALVEDAGLTEFHGVRTATCIAIGPAEAEAIDAITGHLRLL